MTSTTKERPQWRLSRSKPPRAKTKDIDEVAPLNAENLPPRIPEGKYQAHCFKAEYNTGHGGTRKLYLRFRIFDGKHAGTELFMAMNRPEKKLTHRFKIYDQWCLVKGCLPHKNERFNKEVFTGRSYEVLVRNTRRKHANNDLKPDFMQYSVVDTILKPISGEQS